MSRTKSSERLVGLACVLVGATFFVVLGFVLARTSPNGSCDFEPVYYHSRVLIEHNDPYFETNSNYAQLNAGGFLNPNSLTPVDQIQIPCVYPPTALVVAAPLALLKWHAADLIWMSLSAASIVVAALLIWSAAADYSPTLAGVLIGFILINSITVLFEGNAAALAVGLSVIALALFLKQRLELLGLICLAISLCLKPHDGAFVWLFLFLSGGTLRRRAWETVSTFLLLSLPAVLWVSSFSPHWPQEMRANMASISGIGGVNNPGPTSTTSHITNSAINLQTVFSVVVDRPSFYNPASYFVCGIILLCFGWAIIRDRGSAERQWLGIAIISALAMLPVYHRHHDARMLLLAIPACALLWRRRDTLGKIGTLITFMAISITGDIPRAILDRLESGYQFNAADLPAKLEMIIFTRPAPLVLLMMTVVFLVLYVRSTAPTARGETEPEAVRLVKT